MTPQLAKPPIGMAEYEAIAETMQYYLDGGRKGKSDLMRPGFHADATVVGYCAGKLYTGPIQQLFDWIDQNGPAPSIEPSFASIDVIDTIAVVRLEVKNWSGTLAGDNARMSDVFTLIKTDERWRISQKTFHWHVE